ncbi:MAG: magnesium-translocating P-type ATPase [Candidatus Gracilibacteria bacterium]|jgi:Mg2+-importing ATPase
MPKKQPKPTHPWAKSETELFAEFKTSTKGLQEKNAQERLKTYGLNEITGKGKKAGWEILIGQFTNPLIIVLVAATIIAFFLGEQTDAYIIVSIVIFNAILGFVQEYRAEKTVRELKKLISQEATVLRNGKKTVIDAKMVVPGDIVYLRIGDIVPADMRILGQEEMTIDESSLTGESLPVIKISTVTPESRTLPQYLKNMAFMGSHVMSGEGFGIVIGTGEQTFFGKTASYLKEAETISDFEKSIGNFSKMLLKIILAMTLVVFLINAFLQHGIFESFLFALALAVGITPEALPIIITISLSKGAQNLAKSHVVVKKLSSIEDLGNMDILCTDKTGTLTEGKLALETYLNADNKIDEKLLLYGMLCNEATVNKNKVEGNIIDRAIWESTQKDKLLSTYKKIQILDHNEFDFSRRRMSVITQTVDGKKLLVVKGALESLIDVCTNIDINGKSKPFTKKTRQDYLNLVNQYREKGYSTIGIAVRDWHKADSNKEDEKNLTMLGFLAFVDPPRKSSKSALAEMKKMGVTVKVLSGDDPLVTKAICEKVGLTIVENKIYTGDELDKLSDEEFGKVVNKYNVFARISPEHKYKIVKTLNTGDDVTVAFMGDGINDAPAIKVADVGISVNTATSIAKEAADIILMEQSLEVVVNGIRQGRTIFTNITKYILNTVSANYGNMFTVSLSSLFLKFIPLLPSQILLNNLLTDTPMLAIATDSVDKETLKKPKKLDLKMIKTFMVFFGLLSTIFDMALILTMIFIVKAEPTLFRTAWFLESALSEVIVTYAIRTKKPFYKSVPGKFLSIISVLIVATLLFMIYTPIGKIFEFEQLNSGILLLVITIVAMYFISAEVVKKYFFKKFDF